MYRSPVGCFVLIFAAAFAQAQWTTPLQITTGPATDTHPAFVTTTFRLAGGEEWLAFTRSRPQGSDICMMHTTYGGIQWSDTVISVTDDTVFDDFSAVASTDSWFSPGFLMVMWTRGQNPSSIWYVIRDSTGQWAIPRQLSSAGPGATSPNVAPRDSGFGAVWEENGRIAYAEFASGAWGDKEYLTPDGDSGNSGPQIEFIDFPSGVRPFAVWETRKPSDSTHAIVYSVRTDSGWTSSDTIAWTADNRRPRFTRPDFIYGPVVISYESSITGDWEIFATLGDTFQGIVHWYSPVQNQSENPSANDHDASFANYPLITRAARSPQEFWLTAGTWLVNSGPGDSIALATGTAASVITLPAGGENRNPGISGGVGLGLVHIWSVWENNSTGEWKLYGARADIGMGIEDSRPVAHVFQLDQNYPNPFNPETAIGYRVPGTGDRVVTLKVYDVLGREVRTLVNGRQGSGYHRVSFNAGGLSSGVYIYRLQAGNWTASKKMVLAK